MTTSLIALKLGEPDSGTGDSLYEAARKINMNLAALNRGKAEVDHEHPQYVKVAHTHPEYAPAEHAHEEYARADHRHPEYAKLNHEHSQYALVDHTHPEYAPAVHDHPQYALVDHEHPLPAHDHDSEYAPLDHSHDLTETLAPTWATVQALQAQLTFLWTHLQAPQFVPPVVKTVSDADIAGAVAAAGGNVKKAAELLGIGRSTLYRRMKRHA